MDLSRPIASVVPSLDGDVLMVLAGTTRPLTGREVSRLVRRGSWSGVRRVLHRLVAQGLVTAQEATPSLLYSLNRDHVAAPAVMALAQLRTEFFDRIRDQIGQWRIAPDSAAIFGSTARGDGSTESDVDVFLVRPDAVAEDDSEWRRQVAELSAAISRWSGNPASMIEISAVEAGGLSERQATIAEELHRDAVHLAGRPVADVLAGGAQ
jgi:predicted nucleotidyltransferase